MTLNRTQSQDLLSATARAMAELEEGLLRLRETTSAEDFAEFGDRVGGVMSEATRRILMPLYALYPELEPQTAADWRKACLARHEDF